MSKTRHSDGHYEVRCKVCRHHNRVEIDLLLARGWSYKRIGEEFGVPYRSLSNHERKHLNFADPTIREVIEREAEISRKTRELGVQMALEHRARSELDLLMSLYGSKIRDSGGLWNL